MKYQYNRLQEVYTLLKLKGQKAVLAVKDENGMEQYFSGIAADKQKKILDTKLLIYECEGEESEIKECLNLS